MPRKRKYFKTWKSAVKALEEQNDINLSIYKMPKGTRHSGEYAVCSYIEFINTY